MKIHVISRSLFHNVEELHAECKLESNKNRYDMEFM